MSEATCPHCGGPMTGGGVALLCGGAAGGGQIEFPPTCPSRECAQARSEAAIERAIASGLIDP